MIRNVIQAKLYQMVTKMLHFCRVNITVEEGTTVFFKLSSLVALSCLTPSLRDVLFVHNYGLYILISINLCLHLCLRWWGLEGLQKSTLAT